MILPHHVIRGEKNIVITKLLASDESVISYIFFVEYGCVAIGILTVCCGSCLTEVYILLV